MGGRRPTPPATPSSPAAPTTPLTNPSRPTGFPLVNPFQGDLRRRRLGRLHRRASATASTCCSPRPRRRSRSPTGGTLTYTLTVTNLSTDPALSVTLTDPLPAGVTFASCVATAGGVCGGIGQHAHRHVRVPRRGRVGDRDHHGDRHRRHGRDARQHGDRDLVASFDAVTANNTATATSHTPGVNPNDTDNDALPNDWETRFGLDPDSGRRRQRRRRRSRRRRPHQLPGAAGGLAPARLRDHLSRRGRDRHVLRHAASRWPIRRRTTGARAGPLPEGRRHGGVGLRARWRRSAG